MKPQLDLCVHVCNAFVCLHSSMMMEMIMMLVMIVMMITHSQPW
jgi:hypothetical protein